MSAFTYPRDNAGFALCHHGRRIACEECVSEEEYESRSPDGDGPEGFNGGHVRRSEDVREMREGVHGGSLPSETGQGSLLQRVVREQRSAPDAGGLEGASGREEENNLQGARQSAGSRLASDQARSASAATMRDVRGGIAGSSRGLREAAGGSVALPETPQGEGQGARPNGELISEPADSLALHVADLQSQLAQARAEAERQRTHAAIAYDAAEQAEAALLEARQQLKELRDDLDDANTGLSAENEQLYRQVNELRTQLHTAQQASDTLRAALQSEVRRLQFSLPQARTYITRDTPKEVIKLLSAFDDQLDRMRDALLAASPSPQPTKD